MNRFLTGILLAGALLLAACETQSTLDPGPIDYGNITTIDYNKHVQPLLDEYGDMLSQAGILPAGLDLSSWDKLIKGYNRGEVVIPYDAASSLLVELSTKYNNPNPLDSLKLAFLERWIDEGAKNQNGEVPYAGSKNVVFVCNQNIGRVSVIERSAGVVIRNIDFADLGFSTSSKPHDIAVEPDGSFWYVSLIGDGKVLKFNSDHELVGQADFVAAGLLALHPTKDLLYAGHTLSIPDVPATIAAIQRSTMTLTVIPLPFERPHGIVADPNGRYIYFSALVSGDMGVIDTDTNPTEVADYYQLNRDPQVIVHVNPAPDGSKLVASSQLTEQLLVLDVSDPANIALVDSAAIGNRPWHPKYTPNGNFVYCGNDMQNTISVVNTATWQEVAVIGNGTGSDGLANPHGLVIDHAGAKAYVTTRNVNMGYVPAFDLGDNVDYGCLVIIDIATNTIEKIVELGPF
nr:YncE family protein [Calditrichia bacterium]